MLVLTRKPDQSIMIGGEIEITVLEIRGDQVRLGIRAPKSVAIYRKEVFEQILAQNISAVADPTAPLPNLEGLASEPE